VKVIVCMGITHWARLLDSYIKQLHDADVMFHVEPVDPMPHGPNSMTMRRKIGFVRTMANRFHDYDRIIISDAFDVQFVGPLPEELPELLISAEANCYPEPDLAPKFPCPGPWKYVNAGLMIGSPRFLASWCDQCEVVGELDILDQQWLNRRHTETFLVPLDWKTELFYTVTRSENQTLELRDRPFNNIHRTTPSFFHFSGGTPDEPFQAMLRGDSPGL